MGKTLDRLVDLLDLEHRWLLYAQDSPVASGARGLAHGEVFTAEGELVVSVMQEGLIRSRRRSARPAQQSLKSQVKKVLPPTGGNT